jgi:hypothetical protein
MVYASGVNLWKTGRYVRGGATTSHVTEESGQRWDDVRRYGKVGKARDTVWQKWKEKKEEVGESTDRNEPWSRILWQIIEVNWKSRETVRWITHGAPVGAGCKYSRIPMGAPVGIKQRRWEWVKRKKLIVTGFRTKLFLVVDKSRTWIFMR